MPVELNRLRQVHFRDDRQVRAIEYCRVLERLILALRHGDEHQSMILTEIIGRLPAPPRSALCSATLA